MNVHGIHIIVDDLRSLEVAALLQAHLDSMHENSPAESVHALDLDALRQPDITFWTAWEGDSLMGCGALRELAADHGEVKSMRTHDAHLRKGVAAALLAHIMSSARDRGYQRLSLETGSGTAFEAAHRLYQRFGFAPCGPFGNYRDDPFSRFYSIVL
jgi:putative acetyltransferase